MKKIPSYFENFAFKAFKFDDRATPLEYWCVMPVIWMLILAMVPGDARAFWDFLLARDVPPLNPFYYESFTLFVVTFIPRLSLTIRRLHGSGKSGKWAALPVVSLFSGFYVTVGILVAMATMGGNGGSFAAGITVFSIVASIVLGHADAVWQAIFASAAVLNAIGWDAVIAVLAEFTAPVKHINLTQTIETANRGTAGNSSYMVIMLFVIAIPFITAMLHLFLMMLPSKSDHELGGSAPMTFASLRKKGETSSNPYAGYKYLYAKSPEQDAAQKANAKQEIKALYQQRVLRQG